MRIRPLMYVGSLSSEGLEVLLGEVLDNAVDEALAGHCKSVRTTLFPDGSVAVEDDGRGIPVSLHSTGIPALEVIFTKLGACICGCKEPPAHRHGGWGVGVAVVNALSEWLVVETTREGQRYRMRFERGVTVGGLERVGPAAVPGTCVHFRPAPTIFEPTAELRPSRIAERLGEIAALVPELSAELVDQSQAKRSFRCPGGLADLVAASSETPLLAAPIVAGARERRPEGGVVEVRLALQVDACERDVV
ncbi:MAG TPA: ATP-binding protein, partial [Planctomycetota bacterium]|nr:ATP-binding protein [Planctomycetota bacterium]